MKSKVKVYTDVNLNFEPHPLTGDITNIHDEYAVIQSLKNLVSYKYSELKFRPFDSSGIQEMLFDLNDTATRLGIQSRAENFILRKEPRIKIEDLDVRDDIQEDAFVINIIFTTKNIKEKQTASIYLKRVR